MNKNDTKTKILEVAQKLFAEKGFDGASIRDIASQADVNIAAVNYHFQNKQNLYWSVFLDSHNWLAEEIKRLSQEEKNLSDFIWDIFTVLHENSQNLRNAFMMMLSESFPEISDELKAELTSKKDFGPPGGEFIFAAITREVGDKVPDEMKLWAVEALFSNIIHWGLLLSGRNCQKIYEENPMFKMDYRKQSIQHHVNSVVAYLKES